MRVDRQSETVRRHGETLTVALLLAVAALLGYWNSFRAPFVFDDVGSVLENRTIRHWYEWREVLSPPRGRGLTVEGRPVLNLSFSINYAISGRSPWSYHVGNLLIHVLAGLTLFGVVRRTLAARSLAIFGPPGARAPATALGLATALLWTVHPLQTESVTYVAQRAESLMGLFYLLTLYCSIRTMEGPRGHWPAAALLACLLGMGTKEVMVSAPLVVLLYDRTFVARSFRDAWHHRRGLYAGLAATWIFLGSLVAGGGGNRSGSAGFDVGVSALAYGATQFRAISHYLFLAVWPHILVFDYGPFSIRTFAEAAPYAALILLLLLATAIALWQRRPEGFLGAWFFAVLAPTSLVPGTTQMMAEHRMYLALAPLLTAVVCVAYGASRNRAVTSARTWMAASSLVAIILAFITMRRNADYRSALVLWTDTVAKAPDNPYAHANLGVELSKLPERTPEAIAHDRKALQLDPNYAEAANNLAVQLAKAPRRLPEALALYARALQINPLYAQAHYNFANALARIPGREQDAVTQYQAALQINPVDAEARNNLGYVLSSIPDRVPEALEQFQKALAIEPDFAECYYNLANALAALPGRRADAVANYGIALRIKPDYPEAHNNLANALAALPGHTAEALAHYQAALRLNPNYAEAHNGIAIIYAESGRLNDAIFHLQLALRIKPTFAEARYNLDQVLARRTATGEQ